jgi:hypothetical protein
MNKKELTAQQRAEVKRQTKRKGTPTFSSVRFSDCEKFSAAEKKFFIEYVIKQFGGTRETALIAAFEALKSNLN